MANDASAPRKEQTCPHCQASVDRLAVQCPECDAPLPPAGGHRRSSRGRRYVYGKRKAQLSQEVVWLIVVITVGLLIVFGVQVLAFMRSKKLLLAPPQGQRAICLLQPSPCAPEPSFSAPPAHAPTPATAHVGTVPVCLPLRERAVSPTLYLRTPHAVYRGRQVST